MNEKLAQKWLVVRYGARRVLLLATRATQALLAPIGFREVLMIGGAVLLGQGLADFYPPAALIVPGTVFVYVALFGVA